MQNLKNIPGNSITRPPWLKVKIPHSPKYFKINDMLKELHLSTVCQAAHCPNMEECWGGGTATFMLMGDTCTRACRFCSVKTGNPKGIIDIKEPIKVGQAILKMKLDYVVLTSVDRDDLEDLGASHFAKTIKTIKELSPQIMVECLTPDFDANKNFIDIVLKSSPEVFAHNLETVRRLTPTVRDRRAGYEKSLSTLALAKKINPKQITKTSLMFGLGEKNNEIKQALFDLREVGCDIITFGQYLAPTNRHKQYLPIVEYIHPDIFKYWKDVALEFGFLYCASGPLVRSSYRAAELFIKGTIEKNKTKKTYPTI